MNKRICITKIVLILAIVAVFTSCSNLLIRLENTQKEVDYTVKHFLQNINDDQYTQVTADAQTLKGKSGQKTAAVAKAYTGFTVKTFEQQKINSDGNTVIKIYYDRNIITYTFNAGNGKFSDGNIEKTVTGKYGADVTAPKNPARQGYDFSSWGETVPQTFELQNKTFTATYSIGTNTPYTVEHWQQNVNDDEYTKVDTDTEQKTGTTAAQTNALALSYAGFTAKDIEQAQIAADGSTVVKVYYDRNIITYTFEGGSGKFSDGSSTQNISGRYGSAVQSPSDLTRTGYSYTWNNQIPQTFGSQSLTFTASWTANSGTAYKVEHWQQNINDDEYTNVETENKQGVTGSTTEAVAKVYEGFDTPTVTQNTIAADGSTVVQIKYNRKTITYAFNSGDGKFNDEAAQKTVSGRYGATVAALEDPTRTGYTFTSWNNTVPATFEATNTTFTAVWEPNTDTVYTVEHWQQNINNDEYTKVDSDTEQKTGTTAAQTNAVAKSYAGFTAKDIEQAQIAADVSTVVKIYYDRVSYICTFLPNQGNWNGSTQSQTVSVRYGASVTALTSPTRTNYTFTGWYTDEDLTDEYNFNTPVTADITLYAKWRYNGETARNSITIGSKTYDKTEEIYVMPSNSPATINTTSDPSFVDSGAGNLYKGVFRFGRNVKLSPFVMSKYQVTQELYEAVMTGKTEGGKTLAANPSYCQQTGTYPLVTGETQKYRPVDGVTWYDAVYFCNVLTEAVGGGLTKAYNITVTTINDAGHITAATVTLVPNATGYRLPTEAEWEFAARGGNPAAQDWNWLFSGHATSDGVAYYATQNAGMDSVGWYWYNSTNGTTGDTAPTSSNQGYGTHQVGLKAPNALGIFDMSGNVWEWCWDWYNSTATSNDAAYTVEGVVVDPAGPASGSGRVYRGGGWINNAYLCSVCCRNSSSPNYRNYYLGFRVVRSRSE